MNGKQRVVIENVTPEIDGGKFYAKRVLGEKLIVEADIYADGHDIVNAKLLFCHEDQKKWQEVYMKPTINDRWTGSFKLEEKGFYSYTIIGWVDHTLTWQHDFESKAKANQKLNLELIIGAQYVQLILDRVPKGEKKRVTELLAVLKDEKHYDTALKMAVSDVLRELFLQYPDTETVTEYNHSLKVLVERERAGFSAWYELFPRSTSTKAGKHGTFKDTEKLLPRLHAMGMDVLYLPPIHPIGTAFRKGKNNAETAKAGEPGSPWAIGNKDGGHTAVLKDLGTLADFNHLAKAAADMDIEIAIDYALQCSPDHPYVKEHPQWFKWRPDGTVQYAENPPKKYQDVLPLNFETDDWKNLWEELKELFLFWAEQGVTIFRVDNPHTKSFVFWEWVIEKVRKKYPDTIFLSEAFTRPKVMKQLAKVGFTQSYTYYPWRNTKQELIDYMIELTQSEMSHYYRPNFWPNTPDINPYILQSGMEPVYLTRFFMAATLSSNYGFYGPVFEHMVHDALPGREEYADSEKYEIRLWDWAKQNKITRVITLVNQARRENKALQLTNNIEFCKIDNDKILAYFKSSVDGLNNLLMIVNLDPYNKQSGYVQVPLQKIGKKEGQSFVVHDLLTESKYSWNKEWNYIELDPNALPFHLFHIQEA